VDNLRAMYVCTRYTWSLSFPSFRLLSRRWAIVTFIRGILSHE